MYRRPRSPHRLAAAVAMAALAGSLAACNSSGPSAAPTSSGTDKPAAKPVDAAKLVVYSGRSEGLVAPLFEKFTAETGIEVSARYGDSAELAAQLLEEGDRTSADVFFSQDAGALGALADKGRLAAVPPELLDRVDERYRSDSGTWVGVSGRARVVAYNSDTVQEGDLPSSVLDLPAERWKGKVGFAPTNASFEAFVTAMRVKLGEERTKAWLEGVKRNDIQAYPNNVAVLEAVDRGEVDLGLINHYYWFEMAQERGRDKMTARISFLKGGDPGALVNVAGVGLLSGSDRSEPARRLTDYLLSPTAQKYFAEETYEYPLIPGVTVDPGLPPLSGIQGPDIDLSQLSSLDRTLRLLDEVGLT